MKKQYITIELTEYKALRDICEQYQQLIGQYNLLKTYYDNLVKQVTPTKQPVKTKQKIGFNNDTDK